MIFYVAQSNTRSGDGTRENPFRTINQAAKIARPGDTVLIDEGIYREWVRPERGGLGENQRITYRNMEGKAPVISGSEVVTGWKPYEGPVWSVSVDNSMFGEYNPYQQVLYGDWYHKSSIEYYVGSVFLKEETLFQTDCLDTLLHTPAPEGKEHRWYAVSDEEKTTFYADFGGADPNTGCVEISVRPFCFFPEREGNNYITVSGLSICRAATQWAPPTAFQPGLIGPHWSKGWIIENCRIFDSKCCGISLGKRHEVNDNMACLQQQKGGTQAQIEAVCNCLRDGWSKEKIGSHVIRNNVIYNCGQAGVIGHMGGAFSTVSHNHIYHINDRNEFTGDEVAGIKLHAAVDAVVEENVVHNCVLGIWFDWEGQGALVRRNIMFCNNHSEDLFVEVCHGPVLVENNIMLSRRSFYNNSLGTAFVHNLCLGEMEPRDDTRYTLYHQPHSTMLGGVMTQNGGDDRILNNIFIRPDNPQEKMPGSYGTTCYDSYADMNMVEGKNHITGNYPSKLPVMVRDNLYLNGAEPGKNERHAFTAPGFKARVEVVEEDGHYYLVTNLGKILPRVTAGQVTTEMLGIAFDPNQAFENRDGTPHRVDRDFTGAVRAENPTVGPFEEAVEKILLV